MADEEKKKEEKAGEGKKEKTEAQEAGAAAAAAGEAKKRKLPKGRHRSAIKRQRQNLTRQARNLSVRSALKTAIKKVRQAVTQKDAAQIQTSLRTAVSLLHRAATKGVIHPRNASRHIARISSFALASPAAR